MIANEFERRSMSESAIRSEGIYLQCDDRSDRRELLRILTLPPKAMTPAQKKWVTSLIDRNGKGFTGEK